MKNILSKSIVFFCSLFISSCSTDKDCMKIIKIKGQTFYTPTGSSIQPDTEMKVPCDYEIPPIEETKPVENFTYELLNFNHTYNKVNNKARLQMQIKLNNLSNSDINGSPIITIELEDKTKISSSYSKNAISSCSKIEANSSCVFSYDVEGSLQGFTFTPLKFISAKFISF